jgi:uncharacterized phiE125 gp8 family phage protein
VKTRVLATLETLPISIDEARRHLNQPIYASAMIDDPDDATIEEKLRGAIASAETFLGLSLSPKTIEGALDAFPTIRQDGRDWIELPWGPVTEVLSVTAAPAQATSSDAGSAASDGLLSDSSWVLDDFSSPARLPAAGYSWPAGRGPNAVRILYIGGYDVDSDGSSSMPWDIRAAVLLTLGDLFSRREDAVDGVISKLPNGAESLLRPHRVRLGLA